MGAAIVPLSMDAAGNLRQYLWNSVVADCWSLAHERRENRTVCPIALHSLLVLRQPNKNQFRKSAVELSIEGRLRSAS